VEKHVPPDADIVIVEFAVNDCHQAKELCGINSQSRCKLLLAC